jgi:hypothetical protein
VSHTVITDGNRKDTAPKVKAKRHIREVDTPIDTIFLNDSDPIIINTMKVENNSPKGTTAPLLRSSITGDQRNTNIYMELSKQHCIRPTLAILLSG